MLYQFDFVKVLDMLKGVQNASLEFTRRYDGERKI